MRTIETTVFNFDELSAKAQQKAIEKLYDLNVDYSWWESTYDDAENIDLKINGFDLDRGSYVELDFKYSAKDTAQEILKNHGEMCETYILATEFIKRYEIAEALQSIFNEQYENVPMYFEELSEQLAEEHLLTSSEKYEEEMEELCAEFKKDLEHEYLKMLRDEYEYLTSEEAIKETIEANSYEFDEDGDLI
jgi:hypothetical protein